MLPVQLPVERGDVTVIPVARARWGFGGGGNRRGEPGSGGGGGATISPIGYIEIRGDGKTPFPPTFAPGDIIAVTALSLLAAVAVSRMLTTR